MKVKEIIEFWEQAIASILNTKFEKEILSVLSLQTVDSIRRIQVYKAYASKAVKADINNLPYNHTSNPFILSQRDSLSIESRVWFIYLATYFGKSNKSKWKLFKKAAYRHDNTLITIEEIQKDKDKYFLYLSSLDFFRNCNYSNHRKYTKKSLDGNKGVLNSMDFFIRNLNKFINENPADFDSVYIKSRNIPNFGRMAGFDFTSSLSKCNLNVNEPDSMYHQNSTGPLRALKKMLDMAQVSDKSKSKQIDLGDNLLHWFQENTDIKFVAQVLEDSICNWQKEPTQYKRYFG